MKYELIHDTIAQQVYDKVSLEAKARRRIRYLVERQYERHRHNPRILLTPEDLDELAPFTGYLSFSPAEESFILRSRRALDRRRKLIAGSILAAFVVLISLLGWAFFQSKRASAEGRRAKAVALAGRSLEAELAGDLTRSLALAGAGYRLDSAEETLRALYRAFLKPEAFYYSLMQENLTERDLNAYLSPEPPYRLLTMSPDGQVTIWNEALETVASLEGHRQFVNAASFSTGGQRLVTGAADSTARIWQLSEAPRLVATMRHSGEVRHVHWSAQQAAILTVSSESIVLRWDTSGQLIDTLLQRPPVYRLSLSADGSVITGSTPAYTCFWNADGQRLDSLKNPFQPRLLAIGYPFADRRPSCYPVLVRGFTDAGIYQWCPGEGTLRPIDGQDPSLNGAIAFNFAPPGIAFNVASFRQRDNSQASGLLNLWMFNAEGASIAEKLSIPEYGGANFIPLLHPNRKWLYSVSDGQTIRRWETGSEGRPFTLIARLEPESRYQWLRRSAFTFTAGDSLYLLPLTGQHHSLIFPFEVRPPELAVTLAAQRIAHWEAGTTTIDIFDLAGQKLGSIETNLPLIRKLHFSEDGNRLLALAYGQNKHQLLIWNTSTGEPPAAFELPAAPLDVFFDPGNSDRIFLVNPDTDIRYLATAGSVLQELDTLPVAVEDPRQLDITWWPKPANPDEGQPSGTLLMHTRYDSINIWHQPSDGQFERLQTLISTDEAFEGARFSTVPPLWISLEGGAMQVRHLSQTTSLLTSIDDISGAGFSPDGQRLLILNNKGELQMWPWMPAAILNKIDAMHIASPQKDLERLGLKTQKMINMGIYWPLLRSSH